MPEQKMNTKQEDYFGEAKERVSRERKVVAINLTYSDAKELLQEMYKEKGNIPVLSDWKVSTETLGEWARKAIEGNQIGVDEAATYCHAFEERFSQGYPNLIV